MSQSLIKLIMDLLRNIANDVEQITHMASNEGETQGRRKQYLSFWQIVTVKPYYKNINEECQQANLCYAKKVCVTEKHVMNSVFLPFICKSNIVYLHWNACSYIH